MNDTRERTGVSLEEMERIVDEARIKKRQMEDEKRDRKCAQQVKARETAELLEQHLSYDVLNKLKDVIATRNGRKALAQALLEGAGDLGAPSGEEAAMCDNSEVNEWLEVRKREGLKIDPETAEINWVYGQILDPYGVDGNLPKECHQVGRVYFARRPDSDIWVSFYDVPKETRERLWEIMDQKRGGLSWPWSTRPALYDLHDPGALSNNRSSHRDKTA